MLKLVVPPRTELIAALRARDGERCMYPECNKPFDKGTHLLTIDHVYPQSKAREEGWTEEEIWALDNLQLMGKSCNARKGHLIPNEDGTLPSRATKTKAIKVARPDLCETCYSGRLLFIGEICPDCSSGPQPAAAPKALQVSPKECDHDNFHCWMCFIGHVERKSSLTRLIEGP
jgi:hypothetical protein